MAEPRFMLEKKIRAEPGICRKLQFEAVRGIKRLQFLLLEYRFFKDSEEGSALPLSLPSFLSPLSLMLHIVKSRARLFRNLFVGLVVGVFWGFSACFSWLTGDFYLKISVLNCLLPFSRFLVDDQP
jgi:hypothetical protein